MSERTSAAPRDLYLINGFWGETYRSWFTDRFLRSVLAPGNLAALDPGANNKILLATTEEDWAAIGSHPAVIESGKHFELVWFRIPGLDDRHGVKFEGTTYSHVGAAYAAPLQRAYEDKALGIMFSPDLMLSDGLLTQLRKRIAAGANLVFVPAWRSDEAKLMAHLRTDGVLPDEERSAEPIILPPRILAAAMASSVHRLETLRFWDLDMLHNVPSYTFWPVPDNGYVIFGMSGVPCVDYARVTSHDVSSLGLAGLDAYPAMFSLDTPHVDVISDTDEGTVASWTPTAAESWVAYRPRWRLRIPGLRDFSRRAILRAYAEHVFFWGRNHFNKVVYPHPIRLHSRDIDDGWITVERRARYLVAGAVGDMYSPGAFGKGVGLPIGRPWHPRWILLRLGCLVFAGRDVFARNVHFLRSVLRVLIGAALGQEEHRNRVRRRLQGMRLPVMRRSGR